MAIGYDTTGVGTATSGFWLDELRATVPRLDGGLCAESDPEAFFPAPGQSSQPAKDVCGACPIRSECLNFAVESGEAYGVWGGLSERERRRLA